MERELTNIIDDAVRHLQRLKQQGLRQVPVSREALEELSQPIRLPARKEKFAEPTPKAVAPLSATDKGAEMQKLKARALACQKCPHLVKTRTQVVFGVGNLDAELMFVGEAPGADEDKKGEPFVGMAGRLLTKIIGTMGFKRSEVYIANVLKCRPDTPPGESGNRKPTREEMDTCMPYLLAQIDLIQPKVLVALGAVALSGLLNIDSGISRLRGNWMEFRGIPLMPTFHPSYLLYNQDLLLRRMVWEDMLKVLEKLGRPISERQRNHFKSAG